jgi:putative endonuclease
MRRFWVYIVASRSRVLYVGVTNDLLRRAREHQLHEVPGFTAKYRIDRLVHCEETDDIEAAIAREKEIKGWRRSKKIELIEAANPSWIDLSEGWFDSARQGKAGTRGQSVILSEAKDLL